MFPGESSFTLKIFSSFDLPKKKPPTLARERLCIESSK